MQWTCNQAPSCNLSTAFYRLNLKQSQVTSRGITNCEAGVSFVQLKSQAKSCWLGRSCYLSEQRAELQWAPSKTPSTVMKSNLPQLSIRGGGRARFSQEGEDACEDPAQALLSLPPFRGGSRVSVPTSAPPTHMLRLSTLVMFLASPKFTLPRSLQNTCSTGAE